MHKSARDLNCPIEGYGFQTKWKDTLAVEERSSNHQYQYSKCRKAFLRQSRAERGILTSTQGRRNTNIACAIMLQGKAQIFVPIGENTMLVKSVSLFKLCKDAHMLHRYTKLIILFVHALDF